MKHIFITSYMHVNIPILHIDRIQQRVKLTRVVGQLSMGGKINCYTGIFSYLLSNDLECLQQVGMDDFSFSPFFLHILSLAYLLFMIHLLFSPVTGQSLL